MQPFRKNEIRICNMQSSETSLMILDDCKAEAVVLTHGTSRHLI